MELDDIKIMSFGIEWFYVLMLFIYATIGMVVIFHHLQIVLLLMSVAYFLTIGVLSRRLPKFKLLHDGIEVTLNDEVNFYTWDQITSMSGTRHYNSVNLIPTVYYGANEFFNGNDLLFSVSVLIRNATPLVKYIQIKMAENELQKIYTGVLDKDQDVEIGDLQIGRLGISKKDKFYAWEAIDDFSIQYTDDASNPTAKLKIRLKEKNRNVKLGNVAWGAGIFVMGITDYITGSQRLPYYALSVIDGRRQLARRVKIATIVIAALIIFTIIFIPLVLSSTK